MSQQRVIAGRYRIDSPIQRGGMGDVYLGTDLETEQAVAIKTLNRAVLQEDSSLLERFRREADVLRRLEHPNIVRILATVDDEDEHHIVMEFIGGGSLAELLARDGKLSIQRAVQIGLDLTDALARAHRLNIIHRDIKPANILLAEDGTPRLTDFGVAQIGDRQTRLTRQGALLGTIAYLSPELCAGDAYTEKTDIWAFGVVLYEMLAGRHPFRGEYPAQVVGAILNDPPPDLGRFRDDVPPPLADLVMRMLAKKPADRIESIRAVGADLEQIARAHLKNPVSVSPVPEQSSMSPTLISSSRQVPELLPATETAAVALNGAAPRIFVCYRRDDTGSVVDQIALRLAAAFGHDHVVRDINRLNLRTVSRLVLASDVLSGCTHVVVVIGPRWLISGDQGLQSPKDQVRIEIEAAFKRKDVRVLPVLVDGASMPSADVLPPSLLPLAALTPVLLSGTDFDPGVRRLIEQITGQTRATPHRLWIMAFAAFVIIIILVALIVLANLR